jgi:hypothetical protein
MQPGVQRAGRRKEPSESSRTRAGGVQRAGRRALTSAARPAHGRLCAVSSIRRPDAIPYPASESPHRATPFPAFCTARARVCVCVCVCVYIHTALFALEHQRQGRTSAAPWTPDGRCRALQTGDAVHSRRAMEIETRSTRDGPSSPRRALLPQTGLPPPDGPSSPRRALLPQSGTVPPCTASLHVPPVCMYEVHVAPVWSQSTVYMYMYRHVAPVCMYRQSACVRCAQGTGRATKARCRKPLYEAVI